MSGSARYPRLSGVAASPDADRREVAGTTLEVGDSRPAVDNTEYSPSDGLSTVLPCATKPAPMLTHYIASNIAKPSL